VNANRRATLGATVGFGLAFIAVFFALPARERPAVVPLSIREAPLATLPQTRLVAPSDPSRVLAGATVTAPSHRPRTAIERNRAGAPARPPDLGTLLWGSVIRPDGSTIPEVWVGAHGVDGERLNVHPDTQGRYTLGPLVPGPRWVTASATHHHQARVELVLQPGEDLRRQDFVLRPKQRILVRLMTSAGDPLLDQLRSVGNYDPLPVATRENPGDTFTGVSGSPNNPFGIGQLWYGGQAGLPMLDGDALGYVFLNEDGPAWLSLVAADQVLAKQRVEATTEEVTFVLDVDDFLALGCGVRGRVVDPETGAPLAAVVTLSEHDYPQGQGFKVGDDGLFAIDNSAPGRQYMIVQAPGRARVMRMLTLLPGETSEVGDVLLPRAVTLSGRVRDASGRPREAVVSCGRLDPSTGKVSWPRNVSYISGPDGSFSIEDLEPGLYLLRCPGLRAHPPRPSDPSMMSLPQRVDATDGTVEDLELVLLSTTVITLVADGVSEPWPVATARDSSGLAVRTVFPGRWKTETLLHLPPGSYSLEIERGGRLFERRRLVVGEASQRVELRLE
jgi:Carboxypeptidase regulatory-like domain